MANVECVADLKPCVFRVTRLEPNCSFAVGPDNSVTTSGLVSFTATPDIEEGEEIIGKNGCGEICVNIKEADQIKRYDIEAEFCFKDMELMNILTCSNDLLNAAGDVLGSSTTIGTVDCPGAFVEIWTQIARNTGSCGSVESGDYNWRRYIFPKALFTPGGVNLSNELNNLTLSGTSEANPQALDGPFSDMPFGGDIPADAGFVCVLDTAPHVTACGYGAPVPAAANTP